MPSPALPPSLDEIERISALTDPVVRNLQITQAYYELSQAVQARTGGSANWCTFATWASKQAGQSIRKEDLVRFLERLIQESHSAISASEAAALQALPPLLDHDNAAIRAALRRQESQRLRRR
ncbi:MAG: hypothetical protein HGA82_03155 [Anaerolineales bacterium]|nr:hypothetical protein [Anaerolineales bacterium]